MDADLPDLSLSTEEALAACCRILASEHHESGLAGQVTARADKPGTFWTLQFGYGFEEATPERMILVDEDLKPVSTKSARRAESRHALSYLDLSEAGPTCRRSSIRMLRLPPPWRPRAGN
jgi:ribulose-5-phosphate 4-epimerase/fuculose-1-phosphate aldolase